MTKDNASGAGMETVCHLYASDEDALKKSGACTVYELEQQFCFLPDERFAELVRRTDATRLLAESQAHNAKLEAQVERMRQALVDCIEDLDYLSKAPDSAYARPDDTTIANAMRALKP